MRSSRPLVGLLAEPADSDRIVAFGAASGDDRTHAQLLADVRALSAACAGDRGRRWLVETEDAYPIAVCILASSIVGARVALPPNLQPGTLGELRRQSDRVFDDHLAVGDGPVAGAATQIPVDVSGIDRTAALVELFTSGTSGPGKCIAKALCHLEDEVVELEQLFGGAIAGGACVVATVSAHHLYGLLFRLLWPLAAARPFCRDASLLPDDLLARAQRVPSAIVVSSPAHLRHLAASPRLGENASKISLLFSSGGPLETATALALETIAGSAPIEIFGSTETGGVAMRRATSADPSPRWSPFPSVRFEIEPSGGALVVTSPFVTAPGVTDAGPLTTMRMGDRAEPDGDGFRLAGRIDRFAKIGEKSFSLPEIEQCLSAHALVEAAAVATYRDRSGPRLGAVVVLTAEGRRSLAELGRRAFAGVLAEALAERWDRVALPRRWRFVDALACDSRGKIRQQSIEAELARAVEEPREPLLLAENHRDGEHAYELVVPRDLAYLDGHYDAFPLVPGVVQIHWVMLAIGRILGRHASAERMEAVKFKNVLRPAQLFTMRLATGDAKSQFTFTLSHEARIFSSGRVTLRG